MSPALAGRLCHQGGPSLYSWDNPTHLKSQCWDFPSVPVAKTLHSQCRGPGFDPWSGNLIPHAANKSYAAAKRSFMPQLNISHAAMKIEDPVCGN